MKHTFTVRAQSTARDTWIAANQYAKGLPMPYRITVQPGEDKRTDQQNRTFHMLCEDIARSGLNWAGKPRDAAAWKVLLVSGHAIATGEGADMVPGLENEFVNLRESTARMSIKRGQSLIEYAMAFATGHGVTIRDPEVYRMAAYDR